ncbi:polysaccharide deacetylase family protein [Moheibacter sediminis]|uniref:Peptidoglycan/xylan/chitin deacetylase, PgdA/CDA1 family n=1 Tax=Moheibacter sediminis TaxID=1434700 RepID=A0A1W1YEN1_9FLAO|nr:polysaccharide deacetylase family protein [Moheibacter sediminis]SMC34670.1 Peptidoglycan/xylan/chitin deacetylase, PgdA/CDA1 family [Moheibacter sediminis]
MKFKLLNYITLTSILIILGLIFWYDLNWGFIFVPGIIWVLIVSIVSSNIQWNFFLKSISKGNPEVNKIALTFDDGPHPEFTPKVLELLEKYNAQATFFCIGRNVEKYPEILVKIYENQHIIGNHSFTHSHKIDFNNKSKWLDEINSTDDKIQNIIGQKPQFFRPPFGVTTPHLAKAIDETKHKVIGWNIRSFDTISNQNPDKIVKRILSKTKPGSIILLHDHLPGIFTILEQLLPELQERNFTFVTVDELINYESV